VISGSSGGVPPGPVAPITIGSSTPNGVPLGPYADFATMAAANPSPASNAITGGDNGELWIYGGGWIRFKTPDVSDAEGLPSPSVGESFQDALPCKGVGIDAWFWSTGRAKWLQTGFEPVATTLPTESGIVEFDVNASCKNLSNGVISAWDGGAWVASS